MEVSHDEIREFIRAFTLDEIADYQVTAFLMAVAIHGLTSTETAALTSAMIDSGERWRLADEFDFIADKHSTGGVGDKISIVLSPWVAACGVKIAMLSGRGLGHSGGTLDKLESIPGFSANLSRDDIIRCVNDVGCAIATSTAEIAPADRKTYALRDVTGTVESIPLITASIMSKKLAMGASALLLDVKTGRGAFMTTLEDARTLALALITAAANSSTRVEALLTDMEGPLGVATGNANEIAESFAVLRGQGPNDVHELTRTQAIRIVAMGRDLDDEAAGKIVDEALQSGLAADTARRWVEAQGGDPAVVDGEGLVKPSSIVSVTASRSGFVTVIETKLAGMLAVDLGAGRRRHDDPIDHAAGLMFDVRLGDEVAAGDTIGRILVGERQIDAAEVSERFAGLFTIGDEAPAPRPLVFEHLKE